MTTSLKSLFDYNRFSPNPLLSSLIADTESRYCRKRAELSEEESGYVNAAGAAEIMNEQAGVEAKPAKIFGGE